MAALATEVKRRAGGMAGDPTVKWCESIVDCVETIEPLLKFSNGSDPGHAPGLEPTLHLLGHAALTLGHLLTPGNVEPELLVELDSVVARHDVRRPMQKAS